MSPTMRIRAALLIAAVCLGAIAAFAQPSDAQIKKDLARPGQVRIELSSAPMKKVRATGDLLWFWERSATIWRKAEIPEYPDALVVVHGLVRYDIGDPPSYREFKTSYNTYEGIPTPTDDEVLTHARAHLRAFVGTHRHDRMVALRTLRVADEPRTVWHTPLSFSMQFEVEADMIISDVGTATEQVRQETRFYRDAVTAPWRADMVTVVRDRRERDQRSHTAEEVRRMPTLGSRMHEEKALTELEALPEVAIPEFARDVDVFLYTHRLLREADPAHFRAYLMRMLAPGFFVEGSTVRLNANGEELVEKVMRAAFDPRSPYAAQYCPDPGVKHQQSGSMEWWNGTQDKFTRMAVMKAGGTWQNGQKTGETWKIVELGLGVWTDADNIARIASYEPGVLCPNATPANSGQRAVNTGRDLLNKIKKP